jgi:quercetin dioxygenase-like cupin family protein
VGYDVVINPRTGERAVVRQHATPDNGELVVGDLYASPGAAVVGEHIHPYSIETFTVVRGRIRLKIGGREQEAGPGSRFTVPAGVSHDWWNAGDETAFVIVEVTNAPRFEHMIKNLFFLAAGRQDRQEGATEPPPSVIARAREFDDTIRFTKPPRAVQRVVFGALAPLARLRGYRGSYTNYLTRVSEVAEALEALPENIAAMLPAGVPGGTSQPGSR